MRRGRPGTIISMCMIALGVIILLAMILPAGFWWFMLGAGLITLGICWCRKW